MSKNSRNKSDITYTVDIQILSIGVRHELERSATMRVMAWNPTDSVVAPLHEVGDLTVSMCALE